MAPRDPEKMKRRLLAAAAKEFGRFGLAGARVDRIATRAGGSKRMLYYYFTSKQRLFLTILTAKLAERRDVGVTPQQGVVEHLIAAQRVTLRDPDYVRLLQWEALEQPAAVDPDGERALVYAELVDGVRREQEQGTLPADLEPQQLALSLLAVALFPYAFPQVAELFTGMRPRGPAWLAARDEHLRALARHLAGADAGRAS